MVSTSDWHSVRISYQDLMMAWMVCQTAATSQNGPISDVAALYHVTPSVVQRALDRVEAAMGGVPFFVTGGKRTAKLSDAGERFLPLADALIEAWNAALSEGTAK